MQRAIPQQLNYDSVLPLAVESRSQIREFYPEGGSTYGPSGGSNPSVVRIPINSDAMLDAQNSFLKMKLTNAQASSATIGLDLPQSFIRRVRIISGSGEVIEDIDAYNRLYSAVLFPTQSGTGAINEASITSGGNAALIGAVVSNVATIDNVPRHNANSGLATGAIDLTVHLACGFLNMGTYIPCMLLAGGFFIELTFDSPGSVGISSASFAATSWTITDIRYNAHLITLQNDFVNQLRMVMDASGGVLQLSGHTYRHYSGQWPAGDANATINVPARVKSIKSMFFKGTVESHVTGNTLYGISDGITHGLTKYGFRVGSVQYPAQKVQSDDLGEAYQTLRRAFGTIGDYQHGGVYLNKYTYQSSATHHTGSASTGHPALAPFGLSFDAFNVGHTLESGVNSADKSLPITLELEGDTSSSVSTTVDVWALCDAIFYINADGSLSVCV